MARPYIPTTRYTGMDSVRIKKRELKEKLKSNRENHQREHDNALRGWREAVLAALDEAREAFVATEDTKKLNVGYDHNRPVSHIRDYDRVIEMLEWETAEEVVLSEDDFRHFIQDDWDWSHSFKMSTSRYTTTD